MTRAPRPFKTAPRLRLYSMVSQQRLGGFSPGQQRPIQRPGLAINTALIQPPASRAVMRLILLRREDLNRRQRS